MITPRLPLPSRRASPFAALLFVATLAASTVPPAASAAEAGFDPPVSKTSVPQEEGRETICTAWGDVTVIEFRDGPASAPALLVRGAGVNCADAADVSGTVIDIDGMALEGRVGPLLLFTALDPNGAIDFVAVRVANGEVVMNEALTGDPPFSAVKVGADGTVTLKYTRALNGSCSLLQDAKGCWEQLVAEGVVPGAMARHGPPASACAEPYRADSAPIDDPSIVTWDQETTIAADGAITKSFSERVGCRPLP